MFFRAAFNALALFTAFSSAAPAYKADNFDITHLKTHQPPTNASNSQNMTLSFIVYDPNPITNSSALCSGSWPVNGTYPTGGYTSCSNSNFSWNFEDGSFTSISQFTLQIEHSYEDDAVGQYPYNEITNFAKASITSGNVTCTAQQNATLAGGLDCSQRRNGTLFAPITATIAKKR